MIFKCHWSGDVFSADPLPLPAVLAPELLSEMERLGRKNGGQGQGNWSGDASEGMEALGGGQTDKAMGAMERALNKMRSMEERGRDGKGLKGGRGGERRRGQRGGQGHG